MANIPDRISSKISQKYTKLNNTFSNKVKDVVEDRIEIEIGDSKQPDFKPQFKVMRWDNEVNFSIRATEHPAARVETDNDIVKYVTPDYEVHQYEKPEAGEDGGFEFEWLLPRKPSTNVLSATIATKELDFFYQPPLTKEEIKEGLQRPENVEGSYAVYHKTKQNNRIGGKHYKTGKAFHIYRPKAIDAEGNEAWCELNIDEQHGLLTVTVPQEFLDQAIYPVLVDPTFGYTSVGSSSGGFPTYGRFAYEELSENGEIESLSIHANQRFDASPLAELALYESDGSFLEKTSQFDAGDVFSRSWSTVNLLSTPSCLAGNYFIANNTNSGGGNFEISFDSTATQYYYVPSPSISFGTWPDPVSVSPYAFGDLRFSTYATYTASASAPTVTTQAVSDITDTTATGNGNVTDDGGDTITERGICWNTTGTPTTVDSTATSAGTTGAFTASMTGLTSDTTYYVRAYATNSEGTSYGSEVSFTTANGYTYSRSITIDANKVGLGYGDYALDLEASSSQYASITDAAQSGLDITGDISIEAQIQRESIGSFMVIASKWDNPSNRGYMLWFTDTNYLTFSFSSTGSNKMQVRTTSAVTSTKAMVVAATCDVSAGTSGVKIYINGVEQSVTVVNNDGGTSISNSSAPFGIGMRPASGTPGLFFDGTIKNIRLWSDIRTSQEIADNFNQPISISPGTDNLVDVWTLDNTYASASGNNDLTASGSPVFAATENSQTNFPVLFSGTYSYLADTSNGGKVESSAGNDIRFETTGGTKLDHELVSYDNTTGAIEAWIEIPTLSNETDTEIVMYYGKSGASTEENPTGTWNSNYKGIYHLDDLTESSSNGYTLTNGNSTPFTTSGDVGGAADFGTANTNKVLYRTDNLGITSSRTLSGRFKLRSEISSGAWSFLSHWDGTTDSNLEMRYEYNSGTRRLMVRRVRQGAGIDSTTYNITLGTTDYHTIAIAWDTSTIYLFVDGNLVSTSSSGNGTTTNVQNLLTIGATSSIVTGLTVSEAASIYADEVRVLSTKLSHGWWYTEHEMYEDPSTFYSIGAEEGGTLTLECTEVVTPADTFSYTLSRSLSEAATAVDVLSVTLSTAFINAVVVTDVFSRSISALRTEAASITDSISRSFSRSYAEATTIVDSVTTSLVLTSEYLESVSLADAISFVITKVLTEVATIVDSISTIQSKVLSLVDSSSVIDTFSRSITKLFAETATTTDTLTRELIKILGLSETATAVAAFTSEFLEGVNARLLAIGKTIGKMVTSNKTIGKSVLRSASKQDPTQYKE